MSDSATPWSAVCQASLSFTISLRLLKLTSIESMMLSTHLFLCHPLLLPTVLPSIFSNQSALLITWPKYWSFSFSNSPFIEYSGLISFRTDRFDLLAVQGTPQSLLWHHSLKASICDQLSLWSNSHLHTCLLEKSALTIQTFVGKVISLLFNTLYRFAGGGGVKMDLLCRI